MRSFKRCVNVFCVILAGVFCGCMPVRGAGEKTQENTLSVMTYNIWDLKGRRPAVGDVVAVIMYFSPQGKAQLRWWLTESVHEFVIAFVRANPKPDNAFVLTQSNGAVTPTDINSPDVAFWGKTQGWMKRIRAKKSELFVCYFLDLFGEFLVAFSKGGMGVRDYFHRLHRPARKSSFTWLSNATPAPLPEKSSSNS